MKNERLLFTPGFIGNMKVANRVVMAPMATNLVRSDGSAGSELIEYYSRRAQGGTGLIIIENSNVDYPLGKTGATQLRVDYDRFIPSLSRLVEAVHLYGSKIALQLNHAGGAATPDQDAPGDLQPVAPSEVKYPSWDGLPRVLDKPELDRIAGKFARAALVAQKAGFDAIEIHGAHGYLLSQFISPYLNNRNDEYGGNLANRMRFPLQVVSAIRKEVGPDFPVLFRLNADDFIENGVKITDAVEMAKMLEEAGINALNITAGIPLELSSRVAIVEPASYAEGWKTYLAQEIKRVVSIPVLAVGVIRSVDTAERIIQEKTADFVVIGRGLIADPDWVLKAKEGKPIRKCISCLTCHERRNVKNQPIVCAINPLAGRESFLGSPIAKKPLTSKKVVVVGGGPAGMMAAISASERGHKVVILEKGNCLGGQLNLACIPPGKEKISWFRDYLTESVMNNNRIDVRYIEEASANNITNIITQENPHDVIVATGATPIIPNSISIEGGTILTAWDVLKLREKALPWKKVIVIGGGSVGCEVALFMAEQGADVTIVEVQDAAAKEVYAISRYDLTTKLPVLGVKLKTKVLTKSITAGVIKIESENGEEELQGEAVVFATGAKPDSSLYEFLLDKSEKGELSCSVHTAGDSRVIGNIYQAIWDGYIAGFLGEIAGGI